MKFILLKFLNENPHFLAAAAMAASNAHSHLINVSPNANNLNLMGIKTEAMDLQYTNQQFQQQSIQPNCLGQFG